MPHKKRLSAHLVAASPPPDAPPKGAGVTTDTTSIGACTAVPDRRSAPREASSPGSRTSVRWTEPWTRCSARGRGLVCAGGAVLAGGLLFASFPPRPWWFLAPLGIALLTLVLWSTRRVRAAAGYGLLAGLGFFVPLLPWTGMYVGWLPWLALSSACAVYIGLFGALARLLMRIPGWPVWTAAAWVSMEWARSSFPFGGFPWGRLAFGQADGWYLSLAAWGGVPLVGFAVALTGTALTAAGITLARYQRPAEEEATGRRWWRVASKGVAAAIATVVLLPVLGLVLRSSPPADDPEAQTVTVAAIQGSVPRLGLEFNAQRRAVLANHVRRTQQLAEQVAHGAVPAPDLVLWPENSSDIDPLRDPVAAAAIRGAAASVDAPILVGAVLLNDDRTSTNSMMVWTADGPAQRHDKRIIQPFGEYLPMRGFFRLFSDYADRAGRFVPGHGDGVVSVAGIKLGVATCYEVAFDRAFRTSMAAGAQLLTVPTNNATFSPSDMTYQQLAMSRVRAVEHGRDLVVPATTGVSAIIGADGAIRQKSALFTPEALVAEVSLRQASTIATRIGALPEWGAIVLTGVTLITAAIRGRIRRQESSFCP